MNPETRRLLQEWLKAEEREGLRLAALLGELREKRSDLAGLARFLAIKETEEKALRAALDRERWFRSFSLRLATSVFVFGFVALAVFAAWGGDAAFRSAIFFIAGAASFYLVAQAMATWRSQRDQKALREIRERCRQEMEELRHELGL